MLILRRARNVTYIITIILSILLVYSLWIAAPIVNLVEADVGREITCDEAYWEHREIDAFFYPDYGFQNQVIYLSNMCVPVWLIIVALFTVIVSAASWFKERRLRFYWPLVIVTLLTLIPVILQSRLIHIIACATE